MDKEQELLETICFAVLIVIISLGTVGNLISLIIWSCGEKSKLLACSTYFKLISVSDISVLLTAGVYELLRFHPVRYTITEYSTLVCKSVTFGRLFTTQISTWLVVTVTIERTISILFPFKHNTGGARKRAFISGLIISVLAFSFTSLFLVAMAIPKDKDGSKQVRYIDGFYTYPINLGNSSIATVTINSTGCSNLTSEKRSEFDTINGGNKKRNSNQTRSNHRNQNQRSLFEFETFRNKTNKNAIIDLLNQTKGKLTLGQKNDNGRKCDFVNLSRTVEDIAWLINYVTLICCIPLAIILLCNTIILVKHCLTRQLRKSASHEKAKSLVVFTRLVLTIGLVYILSTLPMTLYVLTHFDILKVELTIWENDALSETARTLFCLNNGANFILYFISGEKFRKDFKQFLTHFFRRCST